jgi:hypothetical protein
MILYFPVSALVALFGNILQNPMDPRAKADTRMMNTVVTFLSMLGQEAEQGGVHRMLGICSEFERIAKAVIEKAEKDQASRRKRKNQDTKHSASHTPRPSTSMTSSTPPSVGGSNAHFSPSHHPGSGSTVTPSAMNGSPQMNTPGWGEFGDFDSFNMAGTDMSSPPSRGMYQQPLLPQDLFSLPMNLDFTFAEMSGGAYPTVENGNFNNDTSMPLSQ